jgi:uncharacterized protein DUF4037
VSPEFVPALELNAGFYADVVAPLVRAWPHSAGLLGYGSELLGFDTERSTDHGWGPRLQLFVARADLAAARVAVDKGLPAEYRGWPVAFGWDDVPVTHHVTVTTLADWLRAQLGCNPIDRLSTTDWLTIPQQRLLGATRGTVYHDGIGELTTARERLQYFPTPIRIWMLACQWRRIWQEEPLVGRAAEVGDEAGSRLIAARIVRDLMRLHFLLAGEYWPYAKWFGSAYRALAHSHDVRPALEAALDATDHPSREDALCGHFPSSVRSISSSTPPTSSSGRRSPAPSARSTTSRRRRRCRSTPDRVRRRSRGARARTRPRCCTATRSGCTAWRRSCRLAHVTR